MNRCWVIDCASLQSLFFMVLFKKLYIIIVYMTSDEITTNNS
jgi:hypothetical protein